MTKRDFVRLMDTEKPAIIGPCKRVYYAAGVGVCELQDLVQAAHLHLWKVRDTIDLGHRYRSAYLARLAKRAAIDTIRRLRRGHFPAIDLSHTEAA